MEPGSTNNMNAKDVRSIWSKKVQQVYAGADIWTSIQAAYNIVREDYVLFLPTNDVRCNLNALAPLETWLESHARARVFIIHCGFNIPEGFFFDKQTMNRITLIPLQAEDAVALYALYLLNVHMAYWFKVATLEGSELYNTFVAIEKATNPAYELQESFQRHLYCIENDPHFCKTIIVMQNASVTKRTSLTRLFNKTNNNAALKSLSRFSSRKIVVVTDDEASTRAQIAQHGGTDDYTLIKSKNKVATLADLSRALTHVDAGKAFAILCSDTEYPDYYPLPSTNKNVCGMQKKSSSLSSRLKGDTSNTQMNGFFLLQDKMNLTLTDSTTPLIDFLVQQSKSTEQTIFHPSSAFLHPVITGEQVCDTILHNETRKQQAKEQTYAKIREIIDDKVNTATSYLSVAETIVNESGQNALIVQAVQRGTGDLLFMLQAVYAYVKENNLNKLVILTKEKENTNRARTLAPFFFDKEPTFISLESTAFENVKTIFPFLSAEGLRYAVSSHYVGLFPRERKLLLANRPSLHFIEFIRHAVFALPRTVALPRRRDIYNRADIEKRYFSDGLVPGRTVVLNPTAVIGRGAAIDMDPVFWTRLAQAFTERGYTVATNVAGDEQPIPGTHPLSCTLDEIPFVLDVAGFSVAVRSGFCDLAAFSSAKQVTIYPDALFGRTNSYRFGRYIDFWSMTSVVPKGRLLEVVRHTPDAQEIEQLIVEYITDGAAYAAEKESYDARLVNFYAFQDKLLACNTAKEWLEVLTSDSGNHPVALACASYGRFADYYPSIPFNDNGINFPKQTKELIGNKFVAIWDSISNEAEYVAGPSNIKVERLLSDGYTLSSMIELNKDQKGIAFSGFKLSYERPGSKPIIYKFKKYDVCRSLNLVAYSMKYHTIIDCINIDSGFDPGLAVFRIR